MKRTMMVFTAVGLLVVSLGLLAGSTASTTPGVAGLSVASTPLFPQNGSTGTYNFSNPAPAWDAGNLCVVQGAGSFSSCSYSGLSHHGRGFDPATGMGSNCGCSSPSSLIYNFSINHVTLDVNLTDLSSKVAIFINVLGEHNTINILVNSTACWGQGGSLNVSVLGEYDFVNFVNSASGVSATFALYENHDSYSGVIKGSSDRTSTYFVGAAPKHDLCPWDNATTTNTGTAKLTGWRDSQLIVWANGNGYVSAPSWAGHGYSGNHVTYENISNFACSWSLPTPSTCHGGYDPAAVLAASTRD
jgi:hypothetical protein